MPFRLILLRQEWLRRHSPLQNPSRASCESPPRKGSPQLMHPVRTQPAGRPTSERRRGAAWGAFSLFSSSEQLEDPHELTLEEDANEDQRLLTAIRARRADSARAARRRRIVSRSLAAFFVAGVVCMQIGLLRPPWSLAWSILSPSAPLQNCLLCPRDTVTPRGCTFPHRRAEFKSTLSPCRRIPAREPRPSPSAAAGAAPGCRASIPVPSSENGAV